MSWHTNKPGLVLLLLLSAPCADAVVVSGYFEGSIYDSNVYAAGAHTRLEFTYETDIAPSPRTDNLLFADYYDWLGAEWLSLTLTMGSDVLVVGETNYYEQVILQTVPNANVFAVRELDHFLDTQGDWRTETHVDVSGGIGYDVPNFLSSLDLQLVLNLSGTDFGRSWGSWTRNQISWNTITGETDGWHNSYALFQWDRLTVAPEDVAVPEPGALSILGLGLAGLGFSRRRKLN